jgi:dTDP-4-amino-4,6-dideoxygalactose transaminase
LWGQLEKANDIKQNRLAIWNAYNEAFKPFQIANCESHKEVVELPSIPEHCQHNGHMYYLKLRDLKQRTAFIDHLKANDVMAVFHYIPLHSAPAGKKFGVFNGKDQFTTTESERLVRLPMYYGMRDEEIKKVLHVALSANA